MRQARENDVFVILNGLGERPLLLAYSVDYNITIMKIVNDAVIW